MSASSSQAQPSTTAVRHALVSEPLDTCTPAFIRTRKVGILGYGSQGRAQALNLRDSGVSVRVGLRLESPRRDFARKDGIEVLDLDELCAWADCIVFLIPDEVHEQVYRDHVAAHLVAGDILVFAHGLAIEWGLVKPPQEVDVILVAPKGPGTQVRSYYEEGSGLSDLIAVAQDATGNAWEAARSFSAALGGTHAAIVRTTFRDEAVSDLFGEQAVLCGGVLELMQSAVELLIARGVAPELAYNECVNEMKLITDLVAQQGFAHTYDVISTTAEYGGYITGKRLITSDVREEMGRVLDEIEDGTFARDWSAEARAGFTRYNALKSAQEARNVDEAGVAARALLTSRDRRQEGCA